MILNVEGAIDEVTVLTVKLRFPFTSKHWIRLKYAHLPKLPMNNGFDQGVGFGTTYRDVAPFSSIEELCDLLNALRDDQYRQFVFGFYDGRELEVSTGIHHTVFLSDDMAAFFNFGTCCHRTVL